MRRIAIRALLLVSTLALLGCSGDDGPGGGDAATDFTVGQIPDGYVLWPCETPGAPCNAHDQCALDPICGPDKKCYPTRLQICDDGLECTENVCEGMGKCSFKTLSDACVLSVTLPAATDGGIGKSESRCFKKGDRNPSNTCETCDPEKATDEWTAVNGGTCDDGNLCTKQDYCQVGECKGTHYGDQCADDFSCTDDLCDGEGGCSGSTLKSDYCLINAVCYKHKAKHPSGTCLECDVTQSQSQWTAISATCSIDGKCYGVGDKLTGQDCAECIPGTSQTAWSVAPGTNACFIGGICRQPNDQDPQHCGSCQPGQTKYAWTPLPGKCNIGGQCYDDGATHPDGCGKCDDAHPNEWTLSSTTQCLIGGKCYNEGVKDLMGCSLCDLDYPTQWTKIPGCFNIIFVALNEAHKGNLGGLSGADALCAQQAAQAGLAGTFKAFLSTTTQNVKDLVTGSAATSVAVLNNKGEKLYNNWNEIFSSTSWPFSAVRVYSFNGTEVDEGKVTPDWYDAQAWHGSTATGAAKGNYMCADWTSSAATDKGACGEVDWGSVYWLSPSYYQNCDKDLAVLCVQVAP